METPTQASPEKEAGIILQDPRGDSDRAAHVDHDPSHEAAHAWEHFWENFRWFTLCFLPIILLTVIAFSIDFGSWNGAVTLLLAAARSALIAWFLSSLFKQFSFVFRTLCFTFIFLLGMIYLSLWDSEIMPGVVGNPIYDRVHPESMHP
ncbi:MAG: hypothetical protein WDO13_14375 [Verrucomicrobiota bacterium]